MGRRVGVLLGSASVALALSLLLARLPATAASRAISGKLSKPGYTVIALSASGKARAVRAKGHRFRLKPPAGVATLHLRAPDGTYAGPVVIDRDGKRAFLGVEAGTELGRVRIRSSHAVISHPVPEESVDEKRWARAKRGVPIGSGNFGFVRSKARKGVVRGDLDLDGIPSLLDVDDNGNLVLDNLDGNASKKRPLAAGPSTVGNEFSVYSYMELALNETVNANAAAPTTEQVDAAVRENGALTFQFVTGDSAELDCGSPQSGTDPGVGGLVYCSKDGTGTVLPYGATPSATEPFPDCCDADGDGFGTFLPNAGAPNGMVLAHGARTDQVGTGDLMIERVTTGGVEAQIPATLQYVFATVPALVSYDDGQGNSETLSYPVTDTSPIQVADDPSSGDVMVTLTFWRPQRQRIHPETGKWVDLGHLDYGVRPSGTNDGCPQGTLSESDPNLVPASFPTRFGPTAGALTDLADDHPANPANTFTYTVNLTQCLESRGLTFDPGDVRAFAFGGTSTGDFAFQVVVFERV